MILIHNQDIGYLNLPPQELATEESFVQYVTDNPSEIYRFEGAIVKLKEDAFKVTIDSWMDLKLVPINELDDSEFEEPDYPLPICCPFCKSDGDWADLEKGYCRYCGYYLP